MIHFDTHQAMLDFAKDYASAPFGCIVRTKPSCLSLKIIVFQMMDVDSGKLEWRAVSIFNPMVKAIFG